MATAEAAEVCDLVTRGFEEFVAPDYSRLGVEEFLRFASPAAMLERIQRGGLVLVAEDGGMLAGMAELRGNSHISLLCVDKAYQRRGIAGELVRRGTEVCRNRKPGLAQVTVNSSPYAVPVYLRLGFAVTGPEQEVHGIRFTPMALDLGGSPAQPAADPSPMQDFYARYYAAIAASHAYASFCKRAYGRDFG